MENKEQVYSRDGERYGSYEDMMYELTEYYDIGEEVEVWEADKKEWKHSDFIDVDDLIYNMQSKAMDECGEVAEEYLEGLKRSELESVIVEWLNANAKLNFYGVENEHKTVVVVE